MVAPINSIKHYVHLANAAIASGAVTSFSVAESVVAPAAAGAEEVREGSNVKAVHIEVWLRGNGAAQADTQFILIVEKLPGNTPVMTQAQTLNLGAYPNKKNILYTTQGVISGNDTQSIPVIRDWVLIPKGKQRMGLNDRIQVTIGTVGEALQRCGLNTYKEYF